MKRIVGLVLMVTLACLCCMWPAAASTALTWTPEEAAFLKAHPVIRMGVDPKFVPYEFFDSDGAYKGIAADYLALVEQMTGITFEPTAGLTWSDAYEKAVERKLDMLPCVGKTAERQRYFLYSDPYYSFFRVIIMQNGNNAIHAFDDLKGTTVAVQENSSHHSYLKAFPEIALSLYKTPEEALAAVAGGRETAFVGNYATSMYLIRENGFVGLKYLKINDGENQTLHFAVRTDWPELVGILNKCLAGITKEQKIAIDNRWIGVEDRTDFGRVMLALEAVGALVAIITLVSLYWIIKLKREIRARRTVEEELRVAKREAEQANQIKSSFLARMSHEIRTPLNAITGMSYLIKKTGITHTQQIYLDKVVLAAHTMLGIINDILDFSKIEAGKIELERIPFSLDSVLLQVVTNISFRIEEQGISFDMIKSPRLPNRYVGDPTRLGQVILNLLSNAVKFTEKGSVTLTVGPVVRGGRECVQLHVVDTGIGMTQEQARRLFEPFNQADASISRRYGGTGLGLSIVKSLAELMGGTVEVESELGKGSDFRIELPLEVDTEREREERERARSVYFEGIRTLVVARSDGSMRFLMECLSMFQMNAVLVDNETDATEALTNPQHGPDHPVDLLIVDYDSLGMEAMRFIGQIRKTPDLPRPPKVILMVPMLREDLYDQFDDTRIDLGITKPLIPSVLFNGIIELFRKDVMDRHEERCAPDAYGMATRVDPVRILLVEDNLTNQFIARSILEQAGYQVAVNGNGQEAVDHYLAHGQETDMILMDLHMPVMNGYDATLAIRGTGATLPIVALTADAIAGVEAECTRVGLSGFITKPFDPETFLRTVADLSKAFVRRSLPSAVPAYASPDTGMPDAGGTDAAKSGVASAIPSPEDDALVLDVLDGLRHIGNQATLYREVLQAYADENLNTLALLAACIERTDYPAAEKVVHKMKSSTASIGGKRTYETAVALQSALRAADASAVAALHPQFQTQLTQLLHRIGQYLAADGGTPKA